MSEKKLKTHADQLATVFNFTDEDLAANRAGKLSERQRLHLRTRIRQRAWLAAAVYVVIGILLVFLSSGGWETFAGGLLAISVPPLVVSLLLGYEVYRLSKTHNQNEVRQIEGRVALDVKTTSTQYGSQHGFSMTVNDVRFGLKQPQFLAFKNGDPYTIYYTPNKQIVSVEWLRDDSPFIEPDDDAEVDIFDDEQAEVAPRSARRRV